PGFEDVLQARRLLRRGTYAGMVERDGPVLIHVQYQRVLWRFWRDRSRRSRAWNRRVQSPGRYRRDDHEDHDQHEKDVDQRRDVDLRLNSPFQGWSSVSSF